MIITEAYLRPSLCGRDLAEKSKNICLRRFSLVTEMMVIKMQLCGKPLNKSSFPEPNNEPYLVSLTYREQKKARYTTITIKYSLTITEQIGFMFPLQLILSQFPARGNIWNRDFVSLCKKGYLHITEPSLKSMLISSSWKARKTARRNAKMSAANFKIPEKLDR